MTVLQVANMIMKNVESSLLFSPQGWVTKVSGTVVHAVVPGAKMGEMCLLRDPDGSFEVLAEVIGFYEDHSILTPIGEMTGLSTQTQVMPLGRPHQINLARDLKGHVLDGMGHPLSETESLKGVPCLVQQSSPHPLERQLIDQPFVTGVKAIDGLMTVGRGQRVGIFAAPGVGKSTLISTFARSQDADTVVIALIGERGREVREFIETIPEDVRRKAIIVVATSDKSPLERVKAAYVATTVAEYFRESGENVLFLMDSITRFARSLREVGLSAGEPPARRGYPPSIYQALPKLIERTGNSKNGSITAFYTVLVEGDDMNDPIADEVASLLDGQIVLSRELQQKSHYPAIDPLKSISRCMIHVTEQQHQEDAMSVKNLLAKYQQVKLLIDIGEYESGSDPITDRAIELYPGINEFLKQPPHDFQDMERTLEQIRELIES